MTQNEEVKIFRTALLAGEILVKSGSETYRAEDTIKRMLTSRGFTNISTFVSPTVIIIGDNLKDGDCYIKNIPKRNSNLGRIEDVNEISRAYVNGLYSTEEAMEKLKKAEVTSSYPYWLMCLGCGVSCAAFSILIGGDYTDFIATLITSIIALHLNEIINAATNTVFLGNFLASFIVSMIAIMFNKFGLGSSLESTIVGSVLILVPGVAFTGGVRDFITGDLLSGTARCVEAIMIGIAIAFGVGICLTLVNFIGGIL